MFIPHKGTSFCKALQIIFIFYLKHLTYPFCAPIFRPTSETESYVKCVEANVKEKKKTSKKYEINISHMGTDKLIGQNNGSDGDGKNQTTVWAY